MATERYFVLDGLTGNVTRYAASMQAYTDEQYQSLLEACGFGNVMFHPSLHGDTDEPQSDYMVIVSQKRRVLTPGASRRASLRARLNSTVRRPNCYAGNSRLPVRFFMAMGGLEGGVAEFQKFVDHLKARNYEGLDFQSRILEGIGHSGSKAEGFARGLQAVFARPSLTIDPAILESYVGKYQLSTESTIEILKENDRLVLLYPENEKIALDAETEKDFYMKGAYLFLRFQKNDTGKVTGIDMEQFDGRAFLRKVE